MEFDWSAIEAAEEAYLRSCPPKHSARAADSQMSTLETPQPPKPNKTRRLNRVDKRGRLALVAEEDLIFGPPPLPSPRVQRVAKIVADSQSASHVRTRGDVLAHDLVLCSSMLRALKKNGDDAAVAQLAPNISEIIAMWCSYRAFCEARDRHTPSVETQLQVAIELMVILTCVVHCTDALQMEESKALDSFFVDVCFTSQFVQQLPRPKLEQLYNEAAQAWSHACVRTARTNEESSCQRIAGSLLEQIQNMHGSDTDALYRCLLFLHATAARSHHIVVQALLSSRSIGEILLILLNNESHSSQESACIGIVAWTVMTIRALVSDPEHDCMPTIITMAELILWIAVANPLIQEVALRAIIDICTSNLTCLEQTLKIHACESVICRNRDCSATSVRITIIELLVSLVDSNDEKLRDLACFGLCRLLIGLGLHLQQKYCSATEAEQLRSQDLIEDLILRVATLADAPSMPLQIRELARNTVGMLATGAEEKSAGLLLYAHPTEIGNAAVLGVLRWFSMHGGSSATEEQPLVIRPLRLLASLLDVSIREAVADNLTLNAGKAGIELDARALLGLE